MSRVALSRFQSTRLFESVNNGIGFRFVSGTEKLDGENEDASDFLTECGQPPFPKHVIIIVFFDFGLFAFFCVIEKSGGYCGGIARDTGRMNICGGEQISSPCGIDDFAYPILFILLNAPRVPK